LKFQPDRLEGVNAITRHERGRIWVRAAQHEGAVLVPWRGAVQRWPVERFDALATAHFDAVLALKPELVVFGSGERLRFAAPALLRGLIERRIGVETMDTAAACRTFNVLAGEGRCVVAALLLDGPAAALPEA
jgi:uncharacterized protein